MFFLEKIYRYWKTVLFIRFFLLGKSGATNGNLKSQIYYLKISKNHLKNEEVKGV